MRVLLVDDDRLSLSTYQRTLDHLFDVDTAISGEAALEAIRDYGPYAVVVSDMNMPGISGLELLVEVRLRAPDTTRIMLTGVESQQVAIAAVNDGRVFKILTKPCPLEALLSAVQEGAGRYQQLHRDREILEQTFNGIVTMLTEVLAAGDPDAGAAGQRLRERARRLGEMMKLSITWELEAAAMLARIGLVTIPANVRAKLNAGAALSGSEADLVQRIPAIGATLVERIPRLATVAEFIRYQEKNYDGSGWPRDPMRGDEIPIGARILRALMDLQAAESSGQPAAVAFQTLRQDAARYDPNVLNCLERLVNAPDFTGRAALTVGELQPGLVIDVPVQSQEGVTLISAGARLTPMLLERLRNFADLGQIQEPIYVRQAEAVTVGA